MLFLEENAWNVPRCITHVQNQCTAHLNNVAFAIAVAAISAVYAVKEEGEGDGRGWVGMINQTTFILLILLNVVVSFTEIRIY